jgi:PAS domain-containing protein
MFDFIHQFRLRLYAVMIGLGTLAPRTACAVESSSDFLAYLGGNVIIIAILLSNTVLLLGFLIRIQQLRGDVTRKSIALEQSEQHLRLMGDKLPHVALFQLTYSANKRFVFNYLSKVYEHTLGIDRDRVLEDAKLAFDHIYEADIPILQEARQKAEAQLIPADLEVRVLDLNGNLKWLHISAVPHREKDTLVWDGFMQDVSDSKNIEGALMEEKRNFQNLFETIDDFLIVCDMNGTSC